MGEKTKCCVCFRGCEIEKDGGRIVGEGGIKG